MAICRADCGLRYAARRLAKLVRSVTMKRGHSDPALLHAFFDTGRTEANLVDAVVVIGDKTISNYLHAGTHIRVDFPAVPALI